jgi:hypothetical protein
MKGAVSTSIASRSGPAFSCRHRLVTPDAVIEQLDDDWRMLIQIDRT